MTSLTNQVAVVTGAAGRFLSVGDDLDLLLSNIADIEHEQLYSLRVRKLASVKVNPKFDAIRAAGEAAR